MKHRIQATLTAARDKETELDALCVDAPADPSGRWTAKDHLAHLAWWRERNGAMLDAVRTGAPPPPSVEDDPQNAEVYAEYRDRPLAELRDYARSTWDSFTAAVDACSEEDLMKPHPYAPNQVLWETICGNGYQHTGEHLAYWYLESGNLEAGLAAQAWVRDVAPDERSRAFATYNLGCFLARNGRTEEAIPMFQESLSGQKDLAEWAKQDRDLDGVRDDPRIAEILAATE